MKLILALALSLCLGTPAHAYLSASGNDPSSGSYDTETKVAVKSEVALYSDAIAVGQGLYYSETELTGLYKVSRFYSGTGFDAASAKQVACIAARAVATGDTAGFPCVTRGYVANAIYDAAAPILVGNYLCVGTAASVKGKLISCGASVVSPFVALEAKASGSGTDLEVSVESK